MNNEFLDKIVGHLVDESKISYKRSFGSVVIYPYLSHFPRLGFKPFPITTSHPFSPLSTDLYYHCKDIYGLTEREIQYVWVEYKEIMRGKIEWNKPLNESKKDMQDGYLNRVVKQLVDETEIDFKNRRVKLDAAEYSFPFYSFGSFRAERENIIIEPKSNFGKYIISNYGVDENEYKEIYIRYMVTIGKRLKDHDENVNHLYLGESFEKKVLKGELQYRYIQKVIKHLLRDIKGGAHVPYKSDIISTYGLTQNDLDYLYKIEEEALDRIKGVWFNVRDYIGKVSIGGYDFQFVVQGSCDYEHDDFDVDDGGWDVGVKIKLEGSTVELMTTGEVVKLEIAVDNPDYGWEIESEMGDVIHDIIYAEEPILAALGASILTERGYEI